MFLLIVFGILTAALLVLAGIVIAGFLSIPTEEMRVFFRWSDLLLVTIYAVCLLLAGGLFCFTLSEYVAFHIGYPSSEYQLEKKITTTETGCKNETDTVYFFKRNN